MMPHLSGYLFCDAPGAIKSGPACARFPIHIVPYLLAIPVFPIDRCNANAFRVCPCCTFISLFTSPVTLGSI